MQLSNLPLKLTLPFANAGTKNTIPEASQIGITAGAASLTDGFPPLTRTPIASGGVPPSGADMNGILFEMSAAVRWANAGGGYAYDGTFAADAAVGGYPKGARVMRSDGEGYWLNTAENNATDPEAAGAGWVPDYTSGAASVAMASSNVTLTSLQAGRPLIIISGTLTANLNLIFPTYVKSWLVLNNTTGAFSVTCKTAAGTGVVVNSAQAIVGDGTNIYSAVNDAAASAAIQGAFKNLAISAGGVAASVNVSFDELILGDGAGAYVTERGVSGTITTTATGAGGLDTGALAGSTWYSIWRIGKTDGTRAFLLSLSAAAPTMPAGYTLKARVGWFRTDGTGNKYPLAFKQFGRRVCYSVTAGSNLAALPIMATGAAGDATTPTWIAVGVSNYAPPTASTIDGSIAAPGAASVVVIAAPNNAYGGYSNGSNVVPVSINSQSPSLTSAAAFSFTLESANIYWASSAAAARMICYGWEDNI